MALDPRLTASAQMRLQQLRQQIDAALDSLMSDMLALAAEDRDAAINDARAAAERQAEATIAERLATAESQAAETARQSALAAVQDRVAEVEAEASRIQATLDERVAQAVAEERAQADQRFADAQARAAADMTETRAEERQCELACLERLVDAMRGLDAASTLSHVLDRLCEHAAGQVARVAVLVMRDDGLRAWRMSGFGQGTDPAAVTVPADGRTVVGLAVKTGARAVNDVETGQGRPEALSFAPLPNDRISLALPLNVGPRTVAVLYADEGPDEPIVPSAWPETLEILARHAAARLELLTMARAYGLQAQQPANGAALPSPLVNRPVTTDEAPPLTPPPGGRPPSLATDVPVDGADRVPEEDASALRYARLLISEIKLYNEEAVNQGRRDANLLARLGPEITRARRLYEERVPADVRRRADHFGQELVRTLANGDPRLLGQAT